MKSWFSRHTRERSQRSTPLSCLVECFFPSNPKWGNHQGERGSTHFLPTAGTRLTPVNTSRRRGGVGRPGIIAGKQRKSPRRRHELRFRSIVSHFLRIEMPPTSRAPNTRTSRYKFQLFFFLCERFSCNFFPPLKCPHETPLASLSGLEIDSFSLLLPLLGYLLDEKSLILSEMEEARQGKFIYAIFPSLAMINLRFVFPTRMRDSPNKDASLPC